MSLHDQTVALFIFFPVLCTITLALRLFVRTRLCKGAFGWDDVALVVTWVGLILWVLLAWLSLDAGYDQDGFQPFYDAKNYVCYVISGVVKISVALVLYRLDTRPFIRIILIADMIICATWTVVVTLIISLGCTASSPYVLGTSTCQASNYAQESSYVIFNVLHVLIPVVILWGVQINGNLKWAVVALFGVGLLAAVAAIMKLRIYVDYYNPTPDTDFLTLWYQSMIWAVTEHGLSLFAASILAIRPFFTYILKSYTSFSSKHGYGSSRKSVSTSARTSHASSKVGTSAMELGRIGVRSDIDVRSEYGGSRSPAYKADAYGDGESAKAMLVSKPSRAHLEVDDGEVV